MTKCIQVNPRSWSPDGTKIVSYSYDKTVHVFDARLGECIATLSGNNSAVSYSQRVSTNAALDHVIFAGFACVAC
jgi:WD40 repeat protein